MYVLPAYNPYVRSCGMPNRLLAARRLPLQHKTIGGWGFRYGGQDPDLR